MLNAVREVQIPLLAALLLGACIAKVARTVRTRSIDDAIGPTALFPMRLRKPLSIVMLVVECGLGAGLIITAGPFGHGMPANSVRIATGLMFLVATSALVELRASHPDAGCGCFGDFSTAPVSGRTIARAALLAVAALATYNLAAIKPPHPIDAIRLGVIMVIELVVLGALSPELGEGLLRLGYSEPCELRAVPADRTLAALRRSKQWRRHSHLVAAQTPTDMWRELCWRYIVFPVTSSGRSAEVVFVVFLQQRRPVVHAVLVDALTGDRVAWPPPPPSRVVTAWRRIRHAPHIARPASSSTAGATADMSLSSEL